MGGASDSERMSEQAVETTRGAGYSDREACVDAAAVGVRQSSSASTKAMLLQPLYPARCSSKMLERRRALR